MVEKKKIYKKNIEKNYEHVFFVRTYIIFILNLHKNILKSIKRLISLYCLYNIMNNS